MCVSVPFLPPCLSGKILGKLGDTTCSRTGWLGTWGVQVGACACACAWSYCCSMVCVGGCVGGLCGLVSLGSLGSLGMVGTVGQVGQVGQVQGDACGCTCTFVIVSAVTVVSAVISVHY